MSDIVEELKCAADFVTRVEEEGWASEAEMLRDAAAEIQRLRAEVERLTSQDAAERLAYVGLRSFNGHSMHVDSAVRYMKWELDAIRAEASKKGGEG